MGLVTAASVAWADCRGGRAGVGAKMHRSTFVVVAADRLCVWLCVFACVWLCVAYTSAVPGLVFVCIFTHTHTCTTPPECPSLSSAGIYTHAMDFIAPNHVMPRQMYAQAKVDCNTNCKSCIAHAERTPTSTSSHYLTHQQHQTTVSSIISANVRTHL